MDLVLGIDLGTSYFKLGLFDRDGALRGLGRVAVDKETGDGTLCELPVARFWALLRKGFTQALEQAGASGSQVKAVAYSSQANSFVLLDRRGEALTPLILWPDRRAGKLPPELEAFALDPAFMSMTGIGVAPSPQFCIPKLHWLRHHEPAAWAQTHLVLNICDYLTFALTGRAASDMGTSALLGLLDLRHGAWWPSALQAAGLEAGQLPEPLRPGTCAGRVCAEGAERLGLTPGAPLAVGSLDHHVAALGAGVGQVAEFSESLGTVLACLHYTQDYAPRPACCLGPGLGGYAFYELAFNNHGAGVLERYQSRHASGESLADLDRAAAGVAPGSDGLLAGPGACAGLGLEGFSNLKPEHHHGHCFRALMEGISLHLVDIVGTLCGDRVPARIAATGGGARSDVWLQLQADLLGVEVVRTVCREPACLGAALLCAQHAGWFSTLEQACQAWISVDRVFRPQPVAQQAYAAWRARRKA